MNSIDLMIIMGLLNVITIVVVLSKYKRKKLELERRLKLIENHVVHLEKKLRKSINDNTDATFLISKGLIELFSLNSKINSGDNNA